jgi:metal-responsive CopG/Arc/MetJ family transcriptional regulator
MSAIRINISLPREIITELSQEVPPRKRSRFIAEAIKRSLREQRNRSLAAEYEEAAEEMRRINQELEGSVGDGLD